MLFRHVKYEVFKVHNTYTQLSFLSKRFISTYTWFLPWYCVLFKFEFRQRQKNNNLRWGNITLYTPCKRLRFKNVVFNPGNVSRLDGAIWLWPKEVLQTDKRHHELTTNYTRNIFHHSKHSNSRTSSCLHYLTICNGVALVLLLFWIKILFNSRCK